MTTLWNSLGTQRAVRVISLFMVVYLVVIGFLVFGYAKVSNCLATYADKSAVSTNARAIAATQDRQLDRAESSLAESDRVANRAFSRALSDVLVSLDQPQAAREKAYRDLLAQDNKTRAQLELNDKQRDMITKARAENEEERKKSPPPPPPSQSC